MCLNLICIPNFSNLVLRTAITLCNLMKIVLENISSSKTLLTKPFLGQLLHLINNSDEKIWLLGFKLYLYLIIFATTYLRDKFDIFKLILFENTEPTPVQTYFLYYLAFQNIVYMYIRHNEWPLLWKNSDGLKHEIIIL